MVKGCEEKYAQTKKLLEQVQKWYEKHANKTQRHVEFEVGQHVWLNIYDFKMPDGHTPHFIAKYVGPYEILHKLHLDMYALKLSINFVTHSTFHVSKFKFIIKDQTGSKRCKRMWMLSNTS
jgi:Zn finger protein HypA/HybF involved in hydrogenase expression